MPVPENKNPGDLITAADWNAAMTELRRKLNRDTPDVIEQSLGIGTGSNTPDTKLHVAGGNWNPDTTEGDIKIGNANYRCKIGLATAGGGAGDVRIRVQGGTDRLMLGGGSEDVLTVRGSGHVGIGKTNPEFPLQITGGLDVTPSSGGFIVLGEQSGLNLAIDDNEIMARNNGSYSTLFLNREGGEVRIFNETVTSTRTVKSDIESFSLQEAKELLPDLNPVTFCYKKDPDQRRNVGFIAEDMPSLLASADKQAISYNSIVALLSQVVRSQEEAIDSLKEQLGSLKQQINSLLEIQSLKNRKEKNLES